jgi:rhodanese-related sulfurtransferase
MWRKIAPLLVILSVRELPRVATVAVVSLAIAIAANAVHPMQLPLLAAKGQPGLPRWVARRFHAVDAQEAMRLVENPKVMVIDTRDTADFSQQHIHGAISLPYHGFNEDYSPFSTNVSKEMPLLLYCYGTDCGLAARVAKRLTIKGYTEVTILRGGIKAWEAAHLPLETPAVHRGE